jgi:hypothetical protein
MAIVTRRRRGRTYQPYPQASRSPWIARFLVLIVGVALILGALAFAFAR